MASIDFNRSQALARMASERFDVLVVGGGITGCGVALDAASRGLRTALVEARDFASGTSSKSSKMVHGGLRYLQQHDYLLVYEGLQERQRLLRNAPHLVHPLPFLIPLFGKDGVVSKTVAKAFSGALWLYDLAGGIRIGKRHRRITASEALARIPVLRTDRLVASFLYWDAQADDARLTLTLARTAAAYGAVLANYCPVDSFVEDDGQVRGARLRDGVVVRAEVVINATGVWAEQVGGSGISIRPAKGIHVAVPSEKLPCDCAAVLAVPGDRRSIFIVPWAADEARGPVGPDRYTYIGTTDTDYDGPLEDPQCTAEDIDYVLRAVNTWTSAQLTPEDVTGSWAGLRPLVSDAHSVRTADLSRRHKVMVSPTGLVTVTGGKLTTYRLMAADTVDTAVGQLPRSRRGQRRSRTKRVTLIGGDRVAPALDLPAAQSAHLTGRYGCLAPDVLALCRQDGSLAEPLVRGLPYLKAEAAYAARHEMAQTVADVLSRRTRASILNREAAAEAAPVVAALIGPELGWDAEEQAHQVEAFLAQVDTERQATSGPAEHLSPRI